VSTSAGNLQKNYNLYGFLRKCFDTVNFETLVRFEIFCNFRKEKIQKKCAAANEQFGASGGAVSYETEQVTSSFALVRALPNPPPAAKLPPRWLQCAGDSVQWTI